MLLQFDMPCLVDVRGRPALFWGETEEELSGRGKQEELGGKKEGETVAVT